MRAKGFPAEMRRKSYTLKYAAKSKNQASERRPAAGIEAKIALFVPFSVFFLESGRAAMHRGSTIEPMREDKKGTKWAIAANSPATQKTADSQAQAFPILTKWQFF